MSQGEKTEKMGGDKYSIVQYIMHRGVSFATEQKVLSDFACPYGDKVCVCNNFAILY